MPTQGKVVIEDQNKKKKHVLVQKKQPEPKKPKKIDIEVIEEEQIKEPLPEYYYQPDPLKSHLVPIADGFKKNGGEYFKEGCLNYKQYYELLKHHRPQYKENKQQEEEKAKSPYEIIPEEERRVSTVKNTRLLELFSDDYKSPDEPVAEEQHNNNPDVAKNIQYLIKDNMFEEELAKHHLYELPVSNDKILVTKAFKYEMLDNIKDENIYDKAEEFEMDDAEWAKFNKPKQIPTNTHMDVRSELGILHKYPRERLPRDIMVLSGRVRKEKIKENKV
jgi:hypothetical protein